MELTVAAALSPGAMLGHLSYLLLIVSMLATKMVWLRLLVIASALPAIAFDLFWLENPVGVFWRVMLVAVNVVQLVRLLSADLRARFRPEEQALRDDLGPILSPGEIRGLLDAGAWVDLPDGSVLTEEGVRPAALHFVAAGEVAVLRAGHAVARVGPGSFVGEMALLTADAGASACTEARGPVRAWRLPTAAFERLEARRPTVFAALQAAIARDMRAKILRQNAERIAG